MDSWVGLTLVLAVPPSAWADGKLADLAEMLGKMVEHHGPKSTEPKYQSRCPTLYRKTREVFLRYKLQMDSCGVSRPHKTRTSSFWCNSGIRICYVLGFVVNAASPRHHVSNACQISWLMHTGFLPGHARYSPTRFFAYTISLKKRIKASFLNFIRHPVAGGAGI